MANKTVNPFLNESKIKDVVILGAGFSGMAAGIKTKAHIFEASDKPGGICRTYYKDGYSFEIGGGHWIFGKGKGLDFIKSLVELKEYTRNASVYYNTKFEYPIQTTAQQPLGDIKQGTLKKWLADNFSQTECNLFFFPFNNKYTCGLYSSVIQDDGFKTPPAGGKGYVSTFYYPKNGLDKLVDIMASQCKISYNKKACAIDVDKHTVTFQDNTKISYKKLISTIPLNRILELCNRQSFHLPKTSVLVINIGAEKSYNTPDEHWLYVPFCNSNFFRIQFYSNIEPSKAPKGKIGLCVEIAMKERCSFHVMEVISKNVVKELRYWGFIGDVDIIDPTFVDVAYTWLFNKEDRDKELKWLRERDIYSIGRYGAWKFCGMTESIEQGLGVEI